MTDLNFTEIPHLLKQDLTSDESQLQILELYSSFSEIIKPFDWLLFAFLFLTSIILFQNKHVGSNFIKIPNFIRYLMLIISIALLILAYTTTVFFQKDNFTLLKNFLNLNDIYWQQSNIMPNDYEGINTILITKNSQVSLEDFLKRPMVNEHIIIDANKFINEDFLGVKVEKQDYQTINISNLTKMFLENEKYPAYFSFNSDNSLLDFKNLAYTWANSDNATHILQIPYNLGLVTVLSDTEIWENHKIQTYDNAWLAWYLFKNSRLTILNDQEHFLIFLEPYRYFFVFLSLFLIMMHHLSRKSILISDRDKIKSFAKANQSILLLMSDNKRSLKFDPKKDDFILKSNQLLEIWKNQ